MCVTGDADDLNDLAVEAFLRGNATKQLLHDHLTQKTMKKVMKILILSVIFIFGFAVLVFAD